MLKMTKYQEILGACGAHRREYPKSSDGARRRRRKNPGTWSFSAFPSIRVCLEGSLSSAIPSDFSLIFLLIPVEPFIGFCIFYVFGKTHFESVRLWYRFEKCWKSIFIGFSGGSDEGSADFYNFCHFCDFREGIESSEPARMESWGISLSKMKEFGAGQAWGRVQNLDFY